MWILTSRFPCEALAWCRLGEHIPHANALKPLLYMRQLISICSNIGGTGILRCCCCRNVCHSVSKAGLCPPLISLGEFVHDWKSCLLAGRAQQKVWWLPERPSRPGDKLCVGLVLFFCEARVVCTPLLLQHGNVAIKKLRSKFIKLST